MKECYELVDTLIQSTRSGELQWVRNAVGRFETRVWECLFELESHPGLGLVLSITDSQSNFSTPITSAQLRDIATLKSLESVIYQSNQDFGQKRGLELITKATRRITNISTDGQYPPHERGH